MGFFRFSSPADDAENTFAAGDLLWQREQSFTVDAQRDAASKYQGAADGQVHAHGDLGLIGQLKTALLECLGHAGDYLELYEWNVHVSADGERVVCWLKESSGATTLFVFGPGSSTPLVSAPLGTAGIARQLATRPGSTPRAVQKRE